MFKLFAAALLFSSVPALAVTQVYDTGPTTPGNQAWGGTLGLDFNVSTTIHITGLGSFDAGRDGITNNIYVGIFDATTGTLVAPAVNLNGTANAGGAYDTVAITPLTLAPGHYQLAAWGYNLGSDTNYNNSGPGGPVTFNTLDGAVTATGTHYSDYSAPGAFATNPDNGATRYGAGTMIGYVPEAGIWTMMIGGFALVGATLRRRSSLAV